MKNKTLESNYDKDTGISTVVIQSKWGTFTHSVIVQDEDKDIANKWDGCRFAHYLCMADMLKAKGKAFVERGNGMEHAANVMTQYYLQQDNQIATEMYPYYVDAILDLRNQAQIAKREGKKYLAKAKDMKKNYLSYVEDILTKRRKLRENYKASLE